MARKRFLPPSLSASSPTHRQPSQSSPRQMGRIFFDRLISPWRPTHSTLTEPFKELNFLRAQTSWGKISKVHSKSFGAIRRAEVSCLLPSLTTIGRACEPLPRLQSPSRIFLGRSG